MSRSSSERVSKDEELMSELCTKLSNVLIDRLTDKFMKAEEFDRVVQICDWYADQKIKQMFEEENRNEGDRFMPCSQCKREFEWNGKDKGELVRVRGGGMWCKKCLEVK